MTTTANANHCPLCTKANHCAQVQGQNHCWCMDTELQLPPALLQLASKVDPRRCICEPCARRYANRAP